MGALISPVIKLSGIGCYYLDQFSAALMYADDMALFAPSLRALQKLLNLCETYCIHWDIELNASKNPLRRLIFRYPSIYVCGIIRRHQVWRKNASLSDPCRHETTIVRDRTDHFLVACTRFYNPLCRSVGPSVGPSVRPSHFTFFVFLRSVASLLLPE